MFYLFRQNNSYGKFLKPAREVFIEADDVIGALTRAEGIEGIYFKGSSDMDCPCCGPRWSRHSLEYSREEYDEYRLNCRDYMVWLSPKIPYMAIYYADGSVETVQNDGKSVEAPIPDMATCEATECPTPMEGEKDSNVVDDT